MYAPKRVTRFVWHKGVAQKTNVACTQHVPKGNPLIIQRFTFRSFLKLNKWVPCYWMYSEMGERLIMENSITVMEINVTGKARHDEW